VLLEKLKSLLSDAASPHAAHADRALELTCAALMYEVARSDFAVEPAEQDAIGQLLAEAFALSPEEVTEITAQAIAQADAATCLFGFTRTLNETASIEQKRMLLKMMWRVAMADNHMDRYEEHLIRKVADLLYLPHSDFMSAKQQAL